MEIEWSDFEKIKICVGEIIKAEIFPEAKKPAYKLWIDFGPEIGIKKSSAQITNLYTCENCIGKKIMAVVNFKPRQIGPFMSEVLVTGFYRNESEVVLATVDGDIQNGARLS